MSGRELWTRQGLVTSGPPAGHRWWASHAQAPTPVVFGPRHWRLYFSARDAHNRSRMVFLDLDPLDDMRVLALHDQPLLELGPPGRFDSAGQGASHVVCDGHRLLLYYVGVHLRGDVPYGIALGLAESLDGGESFSPLAEGPILTINQLDPYFTSMIHVAPQAAGSWAAWYMTGTGWEERPNGVPDSLYGLRRAVSPDGRHWTPTEVTLGVDDGIFDEAAGLARPWVISMGGVDRLWFSHRAGEGFRTEREATYRIMDIELTPSGEPVGRPRPLRFANPPAADEWDGFMQAYPAIVPLESGYVMFYNGNGFGQSGFGWATLGL